MERFRKVLVKSNSGLHYLENDEKYLKKKKKKKKHDFKCEEMTESIWKCFKNGLGTEPI